MKRKYFSVMKISKTGATPDPYKAVRKNVWSNKKVARISALIS